MRDALRQYGYDYSALPSDEAALSHIALQLRQAQEMAQQFQPHRQEFEAYLRQRQQAQLQQQQAAQNWWKAPEFDPEWEKALYRDASGNLRVHDGYDPLIAQKYLNFTRHVQDVQRRMALDPIGTLKPGLEQMVREMAGQLIQQHLGQYQEQVYASNLLQSNPWMYETDPNTKQPVYDPMGRPVLSEFGRAYRGYVQEAVQLGLHTSQAQDKYARGMVQRDYMMRQFQAQQQAGQQQQQQTMAQQQQQAANQNFLQQAAAARHPNAGNAVNPGPGAPQQPKRLSERLMASMTQNGINPHDSVV